MSSAQSDGTVDGAPIDSINIPLTDVEFEKRIGRGAFGEVWKCCYFGTDVAVKKMLRPEDGWIRTLIKREIQALRSVRHPNVVQFIGLCKDQQDIYIVTEYIDGGSLWKLLKNKTKQLSWLARVNLALDVSKALAYLHSRNIIHRDLKCKNLLVDRNLHVKVCDFGLCRDTGQPDLKFMTKAGTDEWMAPEVVLGNPYNAKADSFSFGMVLFELITRQKPPPRDVMNGFQVDLNEFVHMLPADCPPELAKMAIECVNSDPAIRPAFMDVLNRLKDLKEKLRLENKANRQLNKQSISMDVQPEYSSELLPPPLALDDGHSPQAPAAAYAGAATIPTSPINFQPPPPPRSKSPNGHPGGVSPPPFGIAPPPPRVDPEGLPLPDAPLFYPVTPPPEPLRSVAKSTEKRKSLPPPEGAINLAPALEAAVASTPPPAVIVSTPGTEKKKRKVKAEAMAAANGEPALPPLPVSSAPLTPGGSLPSPSTAPPPLVIASINPTAPGSLPPPLPAGLLAEIGEGQPKKKDKRKSQKRKSADSRKSLASSVPPPLTLAGQ